MKTRKTTKKHSGILMCILSLLISYSALKAQVTANFSYTVGANGSVSFLSTSTNLPAKYRCKWNFGDGNSNYTYHYNNFNQFTLNTYTNPGVYFPLLRITDSTGAVLLDSVRKTITILSPTCNPLVSFTKQKDPAQPLNWFITPSYPLNITGATWSWGDGNTSYGLYPNHTYSSAGVHTICVTIFVSCGVNTTSYCDTSIASSIAIINSVVNTGIRDNRTFNSANFKLYPNPADENIYLSSNSKTDLTTEITLFNSLGEVAFETEQNLKINETEAKLNISTLPNGIYYIRINTLESGSQTLKFIKAK
jgi:hypothetical protein